MKQMFGAFAMLLCVVAAAQNTYTVKAGVDVKDVVPMKEIFLYENFTQGIVFFRDGMSAPGKLNYNMMIGAVQFIDPKGDTLSLANEETIKMILVANDTFYYSDGYVRALAGSSDMKLGERVVFREYVQKPGAYGLSSSTTAAVNLEALLNKRSLNLSTSQELVLVKNTYYLLGDRFNKFEPVDKKTIQKMFPKKKKKLDEYLKGNDVNYNKKEDLVKMVNSLGSN